MLKNNNNIQNGLIISLVMLPTIGLFLTPYYKFSLFVAPFLLISVIFLSKRQEINIFFYIIIFLIPFGAYRKIGPLNIPWLLAMVVLGQVFFDVLMQQRGLSELKAKIWYYLLPMLFVNAISTGLSPFKETALDAMKNWVAAYVFIGLMLLLITPRGVFKDLPVWIITSVSLGSTLAVMGVYLNIGAEWFTMEERGTGGAPDPNNMCLMIIFTIPIILHYLIDIKSIKIKMGMGLLLLINFMAVFSTNSRGGMLVAALVMLLMFVSNMKGLRARYMGILIPVFLLGLLALPVVMPQKALDRLLTVAAVNQDRSMQRRESYLYVGMRGYMERPIIGYGPFTFQHIFARSREAKHFQRGENTLLRQAHNTYLEILVGSGTLGIILFLGVIAQAQINFFKAKKLLREIKMIEYSQLIMSFQLSFLGLLLYLLIFSDPYHKFLLIMLPLSELALRYAREFKSISNNASLNN